MRKRLLFLFMYICSFICSIAPLVVYFISNHERYVKSYEDVTKLCLGGFICLSLMLLKILGKLNMPSSTVTFGILFLLSYLLKSITDDLIIFSLLALIGDIADRLFFGIPIKRIKEKILIDKSADETERRMERVMERYFRGGV